MHMKARMLGKPSLNHRMRMGSVVIADQMQCFIARGLTLNLAQIGQPLGVSMALFAARDNVPVQGTHGRKQGGGAVAFVVVRHAGASTRLHR